MASLGTFITNEELKKFTAVNGNVDVDKILPFVKIAHQVHMQTYMGTDLFNKISADIVANTLTGVYLTLTNDYLKDMVLQWTLVEYLPWAAYTVANKGVYKHGSENGETVDKSEVDYLVEKARDTAEHYTQRFIQYMCNNSSSFPEYNSNSGEDMSPNKDNFFSGWVL